MSILPIVAVFFLINFAWTIVLARNRWKGASFWLLSGVIWLAAIAIDSTHH
jgi:hypothetical protein